jgi:Tol biopolymer transport system component
MSTGKILSIVVVSLASLIVLAAFGVGIAVFGFSRIHGQGNSAPQDSQQSVSPTGNIVLVSKSSGPSSFLYRTDLSTATSIRLTKAESGIESEASFSHDGKLVVYSYSDTVGSKSSIWLVGVDGSNPHSIARKDEDALHPVFAPDDSKVFYAVSRVTGHYSPVVRPARHDWDVFSVPVQPGLAAPTQITHSSFYDLQSLDMAKDALNQGGVKLLISTTGYPIGALIEEFNLSATGRDKIFQPHVPGEPSIGPSFGEARFVNDGTEILFLGATNISGGNYDYNVYSMSDVTGGEIKQLTQLKGMTTDLRVFPNDKASFVNGGARYILDIRTQAIKPL